MPSSDTLIIFYVLLVFFIGLGSILPLLNDEYDTQHDAYNIDAPSDLSGLDFLLSIITVAFWSINVNIWVNVLLLEPLRILFYISVYRLINPLS